MEPRSPRSKNARTRKCFLLLSATFAFCSALLLYGCSIENQMTAPQNQAEFVDQTVASDEAYLPRGADDWELETVEKTISERCGGFIKNEDVTLVFPPKSLEQDTEITLVLHPETDGMVIFDCFPEGLQFEKPVWVTVDLSGTGIRPGEDATIYWWDPDKGDWVDLEAAWTWPFATVRITHFSRYGSGRAGW